MNILRGISIIFVVFSSLILIGCLNVNSLFGAGNQNVNQTNLVSYLAKLLKPDVGLNFNNLTARKFTRASEDLYVVSLLNVYPELKNATVYVAVQNFDNTSLSAVSFFKRDAGDLLYHVVIVKTGEKVETKEQAVSFASKYIQNPPKGFSVKNQDTDSPMFVAVDGKRKVAIVSDTLDPVSTHLFVLEATENSNIDVSKA